VLHPIYSLIPSHTIAFPHYIDPELPVTPLFSTTSAASRTMPSGGTTVRARKRTQPKVKAQPATSTKVEATAATRNGTRVEVTRSSIPQTPDRSSQAHTAVTAHQSSDVVQTFLFSAASTILWMRDLLPDEYFRTAFYASINKHCSYDDFTQGSDEGVVAQGGRSRPKGYHLSVLKRNVSARGDQIIEWLVSYSFRALIQYQIRSVGTCIAPPGVTHRTQTFG
jgi:hypothetical protein